MNHFTMDEFIDEKSIWDISSVTEYEQRLTEIFSKPTTQDTYMTLGFEMDSHTMYRTVNSQTSEYGVRYFLNMFPSGFPKKLIKTIKRYKIPAKKRTITERVDELERRVDELMKKLVKAD